MVLHSLAGSWEAVLAVEGAVLSLAKRLSAFWLLVFVRLVCVVLLFFNLNAQRLQEFEILVADLELRIRRQRGDERGFIGRFFALLADADGSFEDQEDVVATLLDAGDNFRDLLGIGK